MERIVDYGILGSNELDTLGELVREMVSQGWQPHGPLVIHSEASMLITATGPTRCYQPVVMYGPVAEPEEPTAVDMLRGIYAHLENLPGSAEASDELLKTIERETGLWLEAFDSNSKTGRAGV